MEILASEMPKQKIKEEALPKKTQSAFFAKKDQKGVKQMLKKKEYKTVGVIIKKSSQYTSLRVRSVSRSLVLFY